MKTREDYVSNSSSASFIVKSEKFNVTSLLLELLSKIRERVVFRSCSCGQQPHAFSKELLTEVEKSHDYTALSNTTIQTDAEWFDFEQYDTDKLYEKILAETKEIECDFGLDDCGMYTGVMSQLGALLELMGYDVEASGESPYDSVKKLHLKHLDEILR